ncbi:MAG: Gfo/Idh/MocA family protein [Haloarculaceae archaeon]
MPAIALCGSGPTVGLRAVRYARLADVTVPAVVAPEKPVVPTAGDIALDTGVPDGARTTPEPAGEPLANAERYDDLAAALAAHDVAAVDVSIPAASGPITTAADAGLPVLAPPPLATSPSALADLADRVATSGAWLQNGSLHRESRFYERLRKKVTNGAVGQVGVVRFARTIPGPRWGWNAWYVAPGDALVAAAHDLDVLRWTCGDIERVFARRGESDAYAHLHLLVQFRDGARGQVDVTVDADAARDRSAGRDTAGPDPRLTAEVSGDRGRIRLTDDDVAPVWRASDPGASDPDVPADDCYARLCRSFAAHCRTGERPESGFEGAAATTRTVLAARRSLEEGRPVVPEVIE